MPLKARDAGNYESLCIQRQCSQTQVLNRAIWAGNVYTFVIHILLVTADYRPGCPHI